jgi:hypothetical protein
MKAAEPTGKTNRAAGGKLKSRKMKIHLPALLSAQATQGTMN